MKGPKKRTVARIALLVALPVIALWSFPRALGVFLPMLSPFLGLTSVVATRTVGIALAGTLPMTALLIWRRRFFCRYLCPVGWVSETCGKMSPQPWRGYMRLPRLGQGAVLFTLGGALAAVPFFLVLDPLALFIGTVGTTAYWGYGLCFAGVVLISLLFPGLWCVRLCPLAGSGRMFVFGRRARPVLNPVGMFVSTPYEQTNRKSFVHCLPCGYIQASPCVQTSCWEFPAISHDAFSARTHHGACW